MNFNAESCAMKQELATCRITSMKRAKENYAVDMSRASMARPRGSVEGMLVEMTVESTEAPLPKKTSGLVHAATALRM